MNHPTCPWCGCVDIERPLIDVGLEMGPIEGLAECLACGATQIDPCELDETIDQEEREKGWYRGTKSVGDRSRQ